MRKHNNNVLTQNEKSMEDIVGILIAISIVSKRLAKKLSQLENPQSKKKARTKIYNEQIKSKNTTAGESYTVQTSS